MKKIISIVVFLTISVAATFVSCNKTDGSSDENYKIAVLAHGNTFDDLSFLQSCKDGIEKAKTDFNLIIDYNIENSDKNYQERIDSYGELEYDIIIAIGFMWNEAVINSSKTYKNSSYILVDSELSELRDNVVSIIFDVDEAAFPIGYLAAWWVDSHDNTDPKLGNVGAIPIPQILQFIEPYTLGAERYNQQYNRNIEVASVYTGDFFNAQLGKHLADSLINSGADVIFGVGSEAGDAALLAASESEKWCFGVDSDQYYSFPEVAESIISSAMKGLDIAIYNVIKSFVEDRFNGGGNYNGKLDNDGVRIAPFHNYDSLIADSVKVEIEAIKAGIIDGSIDTGW